MLGKFVCLFVYLTYPAGAFCVARSQIPIAAFESLWVLGTCTPILLPPSLTGSLKKGLSCRPAISIVLSAACSASWRHLTNGGYLHKHPPAHRAVTAIINLCR